MSRRTRGRGYLQQLAQPIATGEAVLTVRPGAAAFAAEPGTVVPVIEDHFEMPARTVSARSSSRGVPPGLRQAPVPQVIESIDDPAERNVIAEPSAKTAAKIAASSPKLRATDAVHQEQALATTLAGDGATAGDMPVANAGTQNAHDRRRKRFDTPLRAQTSRAVVDAREAVSARTSQSSHVEEDAVQIRSESRTAFRAEAASDAGRVDDKKAAKDVSSSQFARPDYPTTGTVIEPATEASFAARASQPKASPEVQVDAGPRVHIGTVEIRMKLPQPPAPPPAAPAPSAAQNNTAMQGRGRTGSAEPLARGLEWSYGLVQG